MFVIPGNGHIVEKSTAKLMRRENWFPFSEESLVYLHHPQDLMSNCKIGRKA